MELSDRQYKIAAWIGRLFLPALATLYGTLGKIWSLPYTEQIPLSIMAVDVFWNVILGIQANKYFEDKEIVPASVVDDNVGQG